MEHLLTNALTFAVLGFMGARLATGLRHSRSDSGRSLVGEVIRRIGWRYVWPVPLVLAAVVIVATALMQVPGLAWGWWSMLGGTGNPVFGASDTTSGTVWQWVVPVVFMALLLPALPLFAHAEERLFRTGAESWSSAKRAWKVLLFGAVHAVVGIPLGAALALSLGGVYFMWVYLRAFRSVPSRQEATLESAAAHTVYNGVVIGLVAVALLLDAIL